MIGFRVDANEQIASGHLMRCIAIAEACRRQGKECLFLLAEDRETERLRDRQFAYRILHTDWREMEQDIPILQEISAQVGLDWLVVDSYSATAKYLSELNHFIPVLYIDDMAQEVYDVPALLHYGLCPDREQYRQTYQNRDTILMVGTEYIPLRREFAPQAPAGGDISQVQEPYGMREKSILLTTGGTDPYHITEKVLSLCLSRPEFREYGYHVIIGSMNGNVAALKELAAGQPCVYLHRNVKDMSKYMRLCELAVSGGGTTLYELCACGIPTVCFSFADNQRDGTEGMAKRGIMLYAGDARYTDVAQRIAAGLSSLAQHSTQRQEYAARMRQLVDGRGADRIAALFP